MCILNNAFFWTTFSLSSISRISRPSINKKAASIPPSFRPSVIQFSISSKDKSSFFKSLYTRKIQKNQILFLVDHIRFSVAEVYYQGG
jgi:hypothetical protein